MKLYEIADEYQNLLNKISNPETGEIDETGIKLLDVVVDDIKNKGIALASYIKNLEAETNAIADAKAAMTAREANLKQRAQYLTDYLHTNMQRCGINEITCPYFVLKLKVNPLSVDITNEDELPGEYFREKTVVTRNPDKVKIKEHILAGHKIPGAILKQNTRLEIR